MWDHIRFPIIYYGDEIGMRNIPLASGQKDSRFSVRGVFNWEEATLQTRDPDSLFSRIAQMVKERKQKEKILGEYLSRAASTQTMLPEGG